MNIWLRRARRLPLAILVVAAACSYDGSSTTGDGAVASGDSQATPSTEVQASAPADDDASAVGVDLAVLPIREGPRRQTTNSVPHVQIDAERVPEVDAELRRRVFALPGVEDRETLVSLPGARGLWLAEDLDLTRPEILPAGREFAHIHPDGSLHVWMPVDRAEEAAEKKWGELHPWVDRDDFWDGVVMIYTPETLDEVDVAMQLVVDAYNYITGANLDPANSD